MSLNLQLLVEAIQILIWLFSLVRAHNSLKMRVQENKIELNAFKHQVDQRIKVLENQYDRVYLSIEKLNIRIDENFKALVEAVKSS